MSRVSINLHDVTRIDADPTVKRGSTGQFTRVIRVETKTGTIELSLFADEISDLRFRYDDERYVERPQYGAGGEGSAT